jgi:hypothetical protein
MPSDHLLDAMRYMRDTGILKRECGTCDKFPCVSRDPITKRFVPKDGDESEIVDAEWEEK